nr:universal stress protein [Burkholderiaceae bacterium]
GQDARILAPTDFSEAARDALVAAAALFPQAQLHIAHAFELPYEGLMQHAGVDAAAVESYRTAARERLLPELARWADAAGVPAARRKLHVAHGYPPRCIEQWIERCGADLVVMAPWSKPPIEAAFIGSVSLHTALTAHCDVLLMRGERA